MYHTLILIFIELREGVTKSYKGVVLEEELIDSHVPYFIINVI